VPSYKRSTDDLESMVIQLYRKGNTTSEIADLVEKMYRTYYTKATISNITQAVQQQVEQFHTRQLKYRYAMIFADATFISIRRDIAAKKALHILVGITPEGVKEVIDYRCYPHESAENYQEMFEDIRNLGCEEVLLFVCDGLFGLKDRYLKAFPKAKVQSCWVHIACLIAMLVRHKDKPEILNQLKVIYRAKDTIEAQEHLHEFIQDNQARYPKVTKMLRSNTSLLTFTSFPQEIWASIYSTNLIEGLNKQLKRDTIHKEQFPNENSPDRFVCSKFTEVNNRLGNISTKNIDRPKQS
jgi:putative transposase